MNSRPLNLTLAALTTLVLCLALVAGAAAAPTRAVGHGKAVTTGLGMASATQSGPVHGTRTAPRAQQNSCGDVDAQAGDSSEASQARTTVCLLNRERTSRGLRPLVLNRRLSAAASGHNRDMVAKRYFAHESRSGGNCVTRIRSTGYLSSARSWMVGENLAWGSGRLSSPRQIVSAWMHSPGHRHNILTARFREIGVGVDFRAPVSANGAAVTYTTEFGGRS